MHKEESSPSYRLEIFIIVFYTKKPALFAGHDCNGINVTIRKNISSSKAIIINLIWRRRPCCVDSPWPTDNYRRPGRYRRSNPSSGGCNRSRRWYAARLPRLCSGLSDGARFRRRCGCGSFGPDFCRVRGRLQSIRHDFTALPNSSQIVLDGSAGPAALFASH